MSIEAPLDVARVLYGGDPAEFVAARDRHAARARRDDGEQRAEAIRALRKPTTAAWAVNRLAVEDAGAVAELIDVGDGLRAAQRDLRGDEIRRLDRRRDELVRRLLDRAGQIVKDSGRGFGEQARRQVESTLSAAVAEPDSARQVRQGVLSGALEYSGFGLDELSAAAMRRSSPGSRGAGGGDTGSGDTGGGRPGRKRGSARQRAAGRTERGAESGERSSRGTESSGRERNVEPDRAADRRSEQPAETVRDRGRADSRRGTGPRAHRRKTERAEAKREQAEPNSANSRDSSATRAASSTRSASASRSASATRSDSKHARTGGSADSRGSAKRSRSAAEDSDTAAAELQRAETELDEAEQHRQDQQRRRDELRRELDDLGAQLRETDRRVSRARRHRNTARRRYDAARGDR